MQSFSGLAGLEPEALTQLSPPLHSPGCLPDTLVPPYAEATHRRRPRGPRRRVSFGVSGWDPGSPAKGGWGGPSPRPETAGPPVPLPAYALGDPWGTLRAW